MSRADDFMKRPGAGEDLTAEAMQALDEQLHPPPDLEARILDAVAGDLPAQAMQALEEQLVPPAHLVEEITNRVCGPDPSLVASTARSRKRTLLLSGKVFAFAAAGAVAFGICTVWYLSERPQTVRGPMIPASPPTVSASFSPTPSASAAPRSSASISTTPIRPAPR